MLFFSLLLGFHFVNADSEDWSSWIKFDASEANSTLDSKHESNLALSRGSDYWASQTNNTFPAIWTGYVAYPQQLRGVHIEWQTKPSDFSIRLNEETVFSGTPNEYQEDYYFPQSLLVTDSLELTFKSPNGTGISFVGGIVEVANQFAIISGVSVNSFPGDYCIQTLSSKPEDPLVLLPCLDAISHYDGRELFHISEDGDIIHTRSNLWLKFCENTLCLSNKEHSRLELLPTNQLLVNETSNCLIVQDLTGSLKSQNSNPTTDAALGVPINVGQFSKNHESQYANDGDRSTYWAAELSDLGEQIIIELDLQRNVTLAIELNILWEYPASSFTIEKSLNRKDWHLLQSVEGNSLYTTRLDITGVGVIRYLRLKLLETNMELNEKNIFGIREIQLEIAALALTQKKCEDASVDPYVSDKFFFVITNKFDASIADQRSNINQKEKSTLQSLHQVMKKVGHVNHGALANCKNENRHKYFTVQEAKDQMKSYLAKDFQEPIGDRVKDCLNKTGYYWVQSECYESPIRIRCHGSNSHHFFLGDGLNVKNPASVISYCNSVGLVPYSIKANYLQNITAEFRSIFCEGSEAFIPLAYKNDGNGAVWFDFANNNLTEYIASLISLPVGSVLSRQNFFGLSCLSGLVFSNSESPSGILCAPMPNFSPDFVLLDCEESVRSSLKIAGDVGSTFYVKCPKNCEFSNPLTGGSGDANLFRDDSSICGATRYLNLEEGKPAEIVLKEGTSRYTGGIQNGVRSQSFQSDEPWDMSFVVLPLSKTCPISEATVAESQANSVNVATTGTDATNATSLSEISTTNSSIVRRRIMPEISNLNQLATQNALIKVDTFQFTVLTDWIYQTTAQQVHRLVDGARQYLKPTSLQQTAIPGLLSQTEKLLTRLQTSVQTRLSDATSVAAGLQRQIRFLDMEKQSTKSAAVSSSEDWRNQQIFLENWKYNSEGRDPLDWFLTSCPSQRILVTESSSSQCLKLSSITKVRKGLTEAQCASNSPHILTKTSYSGFDSEVTSEFFVNTEDKDVKFGIVVKYVDASNLLFGGLTMSTAGIYRYEAKNGFVPLKEVHGVWTPNTWIALKLVVRREIVVLYIKEHKDAEDWSFLTGVETEAPSLGGNSLGVLVSQALSPTELYVGDFQVTPLKCNRYLHDLQNLSNHPPPWPKDCSLWSFTNGSRNIFSDWDIRVSPTATNVPKWSYELEGQKFIFTQKAFVLDEKLQLGTIVELKNHRGCSKGKMRITVSHRCAVQTGGFSIIKWLSPKGDQHFVSLDFKENGIEVREFFNFEIYKLASFDKEHFLKPVTWKTIDITFREGAIQVDGFNAVKIPKHSTPRLGLATRSCAGLKVSALELYPG